MDKILDKFLEYQLPSGNPTWQWNMFEDDFPSYKARFTLGYSRRGWHGVAAASAARGARLKTTQRGFLTIMDHP